MIIPTVAQAQAMLVRLGHTDADDIDDVSPELLFKAIIAAHYELEKDDGSCTSCVDNKCVTGLHCVALGRGAPEVHHHQTKEDANLQVFQAPTWLSTLAGRASLQSALSQLADGDLKTTLESGHSRLPSVGYQAAPLPAGKEYTIRFIDEPPALCHTHHLAKADKKDFEDADVKNLRDIRMPSKDDKVKPSDLRLADPKDLVEALHRAAILRTPVAVKALLIKAADFISNIPVPTDNRYMHYKGTEYAFLGQACLEANPEIIMCIYRAAHGNDNTLWVRPKSEFLGFTPYDSVHSKPIRRFTKIKARHG